MSFSSHISFLLPERSYLGITKREIAKLAETAGFDEVSKGKIDIVVAELSSNLIKHNAVNGELLVRTYLEDKGVPVMEILSVDNGPGMHDANRMLQDGVSTFGSKGEGLGAIKRLSDEFGIYSLFGTGTVILSRIVAKKTGTPKNKKEGMQIKAVCIPKKGEHVSGDAWAFYEQQGNYSIIAIDGLGHGIDANKAALGAVECFLADNKNLPSDVLKNMHIALKKTRGAVVSIAVIQPKENALVYAGIGNISGRMFAKDFNKSLVSYNGTVGHVIPTSINNHNFPWNGTTLLVLHSDGVRARWDFSKYPGLEAYDASIIAGILYKDNNRGTDDALVVVAKR